jgi:hypothetical protein
MKDATKDTVSSRKRCTGPSRSSFLFEATLQAPSVPGSNELWSRPEPRMRFARWWRGDVGGRDRKPVWPYPKGNQGILTHLVGITSPRPAISMIRRAIVSLSDAARPRVFRTSRRMLGKSARSSRHRNIGPCSEIGTDRSHHHCRLLSRVSFEHSAMSQHAGTCQNPLCHPRSV